MTPTEGKRLKIGARVRWGSSNERGIVIGKDEAGIRVKWDDEEVARYPYHTVFANRFVAIGGLQHLVEDK